MKKWLILGGMACLFGGLASASIIPTFTNVTGSGPFTYNYSATLSPDQNLISGSQLCFSDVSGLTGTPTAPTNWSATNQLSSACPIASGVGTTVANDAPSVLYTYSGPTVSGPSSTTSTPLGNFAFQSTSGDATTEIGFGATAQKATGPEAGTPTANQGETLGPTPFSAVPEPEWTAFLGLGLVALAGLRRKLQTR